MIARVPQEHHPRELQMAILHEVHEGHDRIRWYAGYQHHLASGGDLQQRLSTREQCQAYELDCENGF